VIIPQFSHDGSKLTWAEQIRPTKFAKADGWSIKVADFVEYSRQVVVDLIKKDKLKASKLGTHRRIKLSDLLDYINQEDKERSQALGDLVMHTEEFGGYEQDEHYVERAKEK